MYTVETLKRTKGAGGISDNQYFDNKHTRILKFNLIKVKLA